MENITEKIIPPTKPSMLFLGDTDFSKGLFPKLTPKTYPAESEIQTKIKKQKIKFGLYNSDIFGIENKITREPTK